MRLPTGGKENLVEMHVIEVGPSGIPGRLIEVSNYAAGINFLVGRAEELGLSVTRAVITEDDGFFFHPENSRDVSGCWLLTKD